MEKIKIFVVYHKPHLIVGDDIYIPIQAGRAICSDNNILSDMIGDNTGDNISERNPYYSELTAEYWAWKNVHDVEYIGFQHYRRFFNFKVTKDNIDSIFEKGKYDIIMRHVRFPKTVESHFIRYTSLEDMTILMMVVRQKYPEYEQTLLKHLWDCEVYPNNMFICKKDIFDQYATWLFDIFFECEKYIRHSPYYRGKRTFAYFGEFMLPVYMLHNGYRIKRSRIVSVLGEKDSWSLKNSIKSLIVKIYMITVKRFRNIPKSIEDYYKPDVMVGFEHDGINPLKINF